jgi:hypothetical protein
LIDGVPQQSSITVVVVVVVMVVVMGNIQQTLIVFQTLSSCSTNQRSDRAPLVGHELRQMQQLLFLFASPFRLNQQQHHHHHQQQ